MKNILFIDTETTGLNPEKHGIIEIACEFWQDNNFITSFYKSIDLEDLEISLEALKVNNFTFNDIYNGEARVSSAYALADFLLSLPNDKNNPLIIAGHNVSFDIKMIKALLAEVNITNLEKLFTISLLDTATIANFLRHAGILQIERLSLRRLCEALNIKIDKTKLHSAKYDVELTSSCYFKMLKLVETINKKPLPIFDRRKSYTENQD